MQTPQPSLRPRVTLTILVYAVIDMIGMVLFATGAMWFAHGKPLFIPDYPSGPFEAGTALAGGLFLMLWAASRILGQLLRRPEKKDREPDR